ncbi:MAG: CoA pyrophosphatase [Calditrichaeota bacterium]|nr:CoA pyrophosphatase [Calditrichota bacterium]
MEKIIEAIKAHKPISLSSSRQKAAVSAIFYHHDDELMMIFTKRPETMKEHAGEISFPGGRYEDGDQDLLHTAIRETKEEIGIDLKTSDLLGRLDDFFTTSKYNVTPFVFYKEGKLEFQINSEIDRIIEIPFKHLLDPANYRNQSLYYKDNYHKLHYYQFGDDLIWGATGAMLNRLISLL